MDGSNFTNLQETLNLETTASKATLSSSQPLENPNDLSTIIEDQIQFYKNQNDTYEAVLKKCKLWNPDTGYSIDWDTNKVLEELCDIQTHFKSNELSVEAFILSYLDRLNETNFMPKLNSTKKLYMDLSSSISKEIEFLESQLEDSKKAIDKEFNLSKEQVYILEKKVLSYESEVSKFERKYPWLKNANLDLGYIAKESDILSNLLEEKEALEKDLSIYRGLKPDLRIASEQLKRAKQSYEKLMLELD